MDKGADGLRWELGACQEFLAQSEPVYCKKFAGCAIWGDTHRCQPLTVTTASPAKISGILVNHYLMNVCPNAIGQVKCHSFHVDTCARLADLPASLAADIKAMANPDCSHFLDLGYYWFPTQACTGLQIECSCKKPKPPNDCAVPTVYTSSCFLDPATQQPACQKTCKDVGAFGY